MKEIVKNAVKEYFKPLVWFWKFINKPLPEGVCWATGKEPPCKICWECVGVLVAIIFLIGLAL